jgi:hypothetical protein
MRGEDCELRRLVDVLVFVPRSHDGGVVLIRLAPQLLVVNIEGEVEDVVNATAIRSPRADVTNSLRPILSANALTTSLASSLASSAKKSTKYGSGFETLAGHSPNSAIAERYRALPRSPSPISSGVAAIFTKLELFHATGRCSERVRGRLPLPEALPDELGPPFFAPAVQHLEV